MATVRIQLVSWNGEKYISHLFDSLRAQAFVDWEIAILDNGSHDATVSYIARECTSLTQPYTIVEKQKNIGFAGGHNELFRDTLTTDARYVLLLNQDMVLHRSYLEKLFYFMEAHDDAGAVSGRLMKWAFPEKTTTIDSLGLRGLRTRRVVELNGGHTWTEAEDDIGAIEVFGVSGALPLYRIIALKDIMFQDEVFDTDFFSYKEDVDVAWRLRLAGWHAFTVLDAEAHHDRGASGPADLSDRAAAQNHALKSALARRYSYRNHLMMLFKNYIGDEHAWHRLPVVWYEMKKAVYLFFCEPKIFWFGWRDFIGAFPRLMKKRVFIKAHQRITHEEMCRWFHT